MMMVKITTLIMNVKHQQNFTRTGTRGSWQIDNNTIPQNKKFMMNSVKDEQTYMLMIVDDELKG